MSSRSFGYARVSKDDQNLAIQLDALTNHGIPVSQIYRDKLSSATCDRPGLTKCLDALEIGDILVVWRLDRLGRQLAKCFKQSGTVTIDGFDVAKLTQKDENFRQKKNYYFCRLDAPPNADAGEADPPIPPKGGG